MHLGARICAAVWGGQILLSPTTAAAVNGEYREIVPNERVVTTEVFEGAPDPEDNGTVNTMTLKEEDGRTGRLFASIK